MLRKAFPEIVNELCLATSRMTLSTYEQPLPTIFAFGRYAYGDDGDL